VDAWWDERFNRAKGNEPTRQEWDRMGLKVALVLVVLLLVIAVLGGE